VRLRHEAGAAAIAAYLEDPPDSRLIMSMKNHLAQRSFTQTRLFGRPFTMEQLVGLFLKALLGAAGIDLDAITQENLRVVAGRPVRFAGELADDELGEERLCAAYHEAGLSCIEFALEPEAAGYRFVRSLTRDATVLIGDFGGGTSDFSLLRFVTGGKFSVKPLAHGGIGVAGDAFDYRIIDAVVAPLLGKGDTYRVLGQTDLPVPPEFFSAFARWHQLSLMRNPRTLSDISQVARQARHPERLQNLLTLIRDERGYPLFQAVSFVVDREITRSEFESWISGDLARIALVVDQVMTTAGVRVNEIDHVFLTGGTSLVPAVRRIFIERFGLDKIAGGGELVSVAEGLALIGSDLSRRRSA
jgi:hypothetical chaperone protein